MELWTFVQVCPDVYFLLLHWPPHVGVRKHVQIFELKSQVFLGFTVVSHITFYSL